MKKITYLGLLGASTVLCLSFFQNCSKIATADLASTLAGQKVSADGGVAITTNPDLGTVDGTGSANLTPNNNAGSLVLTTSNTGGTAGPVRSSTTDPKVDDEDRNVVNGAEVKTKDKEDVDAIAACLKQGSGSMGSINHSNGPKDISVIDEPSLDHLNGHIVVRPARGHSRGHIGKIENHNGSIILCNMDVDSIDHINGNVKLINCNVGRVGHITGGIKQVVNENE